MVEDIVTLCSNRKIAITTHFVAIEKKLMLHIYMYIYVSVYLCN